MEKRSLVVLTFLATFFVYCGCNKNVEKSSAKINGWEKAEREWAAFAEQYLKKVHEEESKTPAYKYDSKGYWTVFEEIKSPLINKFFPNHRIFREQLAGAQVLGAFALNKDGTIIDISDGWESKVIKDPVSGTDTKPAYNPRYTDFVRSQNVRINRAKEAGEFNKLTEMIMFGWPVNRYKYIATKEDGFWHGTSSAHCHLWIIVEDEENKIKDIFSVSCVFQCRALWEYFKNLHFSNDAMTGK